MITKSSKLVDDKSGYFRLVVSTPCEANTNIMSAVSPKLCCVTKRAGRDKACTKLRPHIKDDIGAIENVGPKTIEKFGTYKISKGEASSYEDGTLPIDLL